MQIPKDTDLKNEIIKIVTKRVQLPHYKIFCFGSRVKGNADTRSDIDIGIEASEQIPLEIMSKIKTDFEKIPILQQIDIVDFNMVSADFKKIASQNMEIIYEK
jgi:predicted nucleotidyltransferase